MLKNSDTELTEVEKITELTNEDKSFLKSKTPASLPDNPSSKGFSAAQIKSKMSDGFLILFDWINLTRKNMNASLEEITINLNNLDYRWSNPVETFKEAIEKDVLEFIHAEEESRATGDAETLNAAKAYTDEKRNLSKQEIDTKLAIETARNTYLTIYNASMIYPTKEAVSEAIDYAITSLVNGSQESLDTLKELSDALGNDPNFATTVSNQIGTKIDKVEANNKFATKTELESEKANRESQDESVSSELKALVTENVNAINEEVAKKINETTADSRYATKTALESEKASRASGDTSTLNSAKAYTDSSVKTLSDKVDLKLDTATAKTTYLSKTDAANTYPTKESVKTDISTAINDLVDGSQDTLDTLKEISNALGDDPNFATTITELIGTKISTDDANAKFATKTSLNSEASNRSSGDANTLTSAKNYTDSKATEINKVVDTKLNAVEASETYATKTELSSETSARSTGDSSTLSSANKYTADKVTIINAELAKKLDAEEASETYATKEESTTGDSAALASSKTYTDGKISTVTAEVNKKLNTSDAASTYLAKTDAEIIYPTKTAVSSEIKTAIDNLVDGASEELDTLKELADALGDNKNFSATVTSELAKKLDKDTASTTYATIDYTDSTVATAKSDAIATAKSHTDKNIANVNITLGNKLDKTSAADTYITKTDSNTNDNNILEESKAHTDTEVSALRTEAGNKYYTKDAHVAYNKEIMGWTYGGAYIAWPGTSVENPYPTPPYASFWAASLAIQENKTDIESKLSAEEAARIEADESLQEQVTDINGKYASKTSLESVRSELKGTSYVNGVEVYIDSNGEMQPALASWKSLASLGVSLSGVQLECLLNVRTEESERKSADSALNTKITDINTDFTAKYNELAALLPTKVDKPENDEFALLSYVNNKFTELIGAAPEELNTLKELADALGEDKNFSGTVTSKLSEIETSLAKKAESSAIKDWALKTELESETSARTAGDTAALKSAKDYTDAEVGSLTTDVNTKITNINTSLGKKVETSLLEANYDTSLEVNAKIAAVKDEVVTGSGFASDVDLKQEVKDRQAADTALDTKISNEATARASAITAIKGATTPTNLKTIEAISASLGDKTDFVSYLSTELGKKANTSAIKNWALQTSLDSEASTRATADTSLQNQITALGSSKLDKPASGSYALKTEVPALAKATAEKAASDAVTSLLDGSPEALNTLNELAAALGDDPNFATTILNKIDTKADKTDIPTMPDLSGYATKTERESGDSSTLASAKTYADSKVGTEATTRYSEDSTLRNLINSEVTNRQNGDSSTLASAKSYTDSAVSRKMDTTTANSQFATWGSLSYYQSLFDSGYDDYYSFSSYGEDWFELPNANDTDIYYEYYYSISGEELTGYHEVSIRLYNFMGVINGITYSVPTTVSTTSIILINGENLNIKMTPFLNINNSKPYMINAYYTCFRSSESTNFHLYINGVCTGGMCYFLNETDGFELAIFSWYRQIR